MVSIVLVSVAIFILFLMLIFVIGGIDIENCICVGLYNTYPDPSVCSEWIEIMISAIV